MNTRHRLGVASLALLSQTLLIQLAGSIDRSLRSGSGGAKGREVMSFQICPRFKASDDEKGRLFGVLVPQAFLPPFLQSILTLIPEGLDGILSGSNFS